MSLKTSALTHHCWDSHTDVTNRLFSLWGQQGVFDDLGVICVVELQICFGNRVSCIPG